MSRTTNTRRRLSLLASSSLAVASLMGGAGLVTLAPTQALAADECGDPSLNAGGDDVLACNGAYATGIDYTATVDGNLVLLMVDTVTVADGGVRVVGGAGESLGIATVTGIPGGGDLNVTNTGGFGITLTGDTADVAVTITESDAADGTPSVSGSVGGIRIRTTNGGNADLVMEAGTATGTGSYGLSAQTTGGGAATVDFGSTTVSGAEGVRAQAPGGTASVTGSGTITTTGVGYGVFAGGGAGGSTVDVSGDIVAADVGVRAQATGGGNVTVTVGNITAGGIALSAEALSGGSVTVLGTGDLEGSSGIVADANLGGSISVTTGGATTGTAGDGINLSTTLGGTVFLDSSAGLVTAATVGVNVTTFDGDQDITVGDITAVTGTGIDLDATGAGAITLNIVGDVFAEEGSNITTESGDIDITIAAGGSIESLDQANFITVDVDANAGGNIAITVDGGVTGEVNANAFGGGTITFDGTGGVNESAGFGGANFFTDTGDIVLEFDGTLTSAGNALTAQTTDGDVTGTMDADITANGGDAVFVAVTGTGSVNLTLNGTIDGGPNAGNDGIEISTVTGDITLTTNGTVTGDPGVVLNSAGGAILYFANNDVTGDAGGITATNTSGTVTLEVANAGTDIVGDNDGDTVGDGINVQTTGGAIDVFTAGGTTVSGGNGILVTGGAGDIDVRTQGSVTGSNGAGVSASGGGIVNVTTADVTSTNGTGVAAFSNGGAVTIVTTGGVVTTTNGNGVQGQSLGGDILDIDVGAVSATGGYGVVASANGGALTIDASSTVSGATAGIRSINTSGTTVIVTSNAAITGTAGDGIEAASGSGSILVNAFGSVTGTADGIDATSTSGNVVVSTGFGTTSGGTGDGVNIETAGAGTGTAVLFGAISGVNGVDVATVDGLADVQGNGGSVTVTSTGGDAIQASSANGGTSVTLTGPDGALVAVGGDGVDATSTGAGVSVFNTWTVDATGTGIAASGVTGADVTNTGVISGNAASGITAESSAGGVFIDNDAAIGSAANGVTNFGILGFASAGAGTVTISTDADVYSDVFGVVAQSNGFGNLDVEIGAGITVEGTSTYGVAAIQTNAGAVATVDVEVGDGTTIIGGIGGIVALNAGTGVTTVTVGDNVVIDPTDYGIYQAGGGEQTLVAGNNLNIDINNTDADATAVGILVASTALSDVALGDPTVDVQIGTGLVITVDDGVGGQADGSAGIGVQTQGSASSSIVIGDGHSILVVGDASVGVGAASDTGDISITTGTGLIQVSTGDGADATANFPGTAAIGAISTGGNISITANGGLGANAAAGLGAAGVYGETTGTGTVTVVVNGGIGSTDDGVDVNSVDGDISVTLSALSGGINATNIGIQAVTSGAGDVTVTANQSISTTQNDGIQAFSTSGSVLIDTAAGIVITSGDDGIQAFVDGGAGTLVVTNRAAIDPNAALTSGYGVYAVNNGSGLTNVTQTATGSVSGRASYGLVAIGETGQTTITNSGTIGTVGDAVNFDGIYVEIENAAAVAGAGASNSGAIFAGGNAIYVQNDGTGAASVNNTGALVAGDEGIEVIAAGGGISVNSNGTIVAGDSGILTSNSGAGTTLINVNANIAASLAPATGAGVNASTTGAGGIDINVANGVSVAGANGSAIRTSSNGGVVTVDLGTGGVGALATTATSAGAGATSWVVDLNNAAGGTTTLTVASNATVRSTDNTTAGYDDLAIRGIGGSVVINNAGRIQGRVNFAGLTGNVVFNNTSGLSWHTTGTSTFSGGADVLNNAAAGVIYTNAGGAATTFDFGAGADTFTNAGILVVGEPALAASTLTLTSLETWNNSGSIFFGSSGTTASDGQINDRILASGTTFNGTGNSRLFMDVNLGAVTQASCAVLAAADCLSLTGGSTTGSTTIRFNDVSGNAFGAFNPTGIVVVDVSGAGSTSATNFSLLAGQPLWRADLNSADGVLDKGLFFYDLTLNGNKQHVLVGLPDGEAFEFTTVGQAAQAAWYTTTGTWFDRQADLRDQLGDAEAGAGVWMKITGSAADRDLINSYDLFGVTYSFDTSYDQNTVSLIGGIDFVGASTAESQWVIGGMIGYVDSDVNFDASPTAYSLEGLVIGAYASYVNKGYFIDGVISGNLMSMDYQAPTLAPAPNNIFSGDVDTWGGQVEGGYTFPLGGAAFIEPLVSLAYVTTSVDAIDLPGVTIDWDDQTSLRGSLGARIGTTAELDTFDAKFSLTGRIWNEFEGENELTILSGGPDLGLSDDFSGSFGEVSGSINLFSNKAAFSAFLNAGVKFKDDYQSTDATLGFRWRW